MTVLALPSGASAKTTLNEDLQDYTHIKKFVTAVFETYVVKKEKPKEEPKPIPAPVEPAPAPVPPPPPPPDWQIAVSDSGSGSVGYPYGQCTYYVALKRSVNWFGNAADWWWNSPRPHGQTPRPGAIYVGWDNSYYGHVAYVEEVYGPDSWRMTEMNVVGWGITSSRTVTRWDVPLIGFLY